MKCPNCKTEISEKKLKNELKRCAICNEIIGCVHCRTPGTLSFKFCASHDPRGAFTDDKLYNPYQKDADKIREDILEKPALKQSEVGKLMKMLNNECKKCETEYYGGDYEKIKNVTKPFADALIEIGEPAVPKLIKFINDGRRKKKTGMLYICAYTLGKIKNEQALQTLCDTLHREDEIAFVAGDALISYGEDSIKYIKNFIYDSGHISAMAAYILSGIKSEKSIDLLIHGVEEKIKNSDWDNAGNFFSYLKTYQKKFNDRRAINYIDNIEKRLEKWNRHIDEYQDWKKYLPPSGETFYTVLGIDEKEIYKFLSEKEIRNFIRNKYISLEKTPKTNVAYDVLRKSSVREEYDWMLLNHEFIKGLVNFIEVHKIETGREEEIPDNMSLNDMRKMIEKMI